MTGRGKNSTTRREFRRFENANIVFFYPNEATLAFFHPQVNVRWLWRVVGVVLNFERVKCEHVATGLLQSSLT